ncbi:MAG: efflux RND transporter periplasmic adaptor subunit [Candidatus Binatia bacterium]
MNSIKQSSFVGAAVLIVATGLVYCGFGPLPSPPRALAASEHGHDEGEHHRNIVRLSASQMEEFGVEVGRAGHGQITGYVVLPGEVLPNADRVAHIVPRYAGIVKEVRSRIGDRVTTGEVLAVIESSESLTPYELRTLLDGTVIAKHITRGEAVTRDTQTFVIADLSDVWIELSIYQRDLTHVKVGQRVLVSSGHHLPDIEGTISYVSPVVDEDTRTARARLVMQNSDGRWRPGMFVTGRVAVNAADVPIAVPHTALQTVDGHTVVFVEEDDGFEAREVELGRASATHAEILTGLSAGERYVTRGGFILKAELGRSELSEGHSH